jgi:hypothetical protein
MDAARARLIGTLERLSAELGSGSTLAQCLRRLPRTDYHSLCAPLNPGSHWRWRWQPESLPPDEALLLARIALAAGAEEPDRLAVRLAQLAADLREAGT